LDDLDDIRALNQARGPSCMMGKVLAAMDPTVRDKLDRAIASPDIEMKSIVRWLAQRGIAIGYTTFRRHYAHECRCG
jgi:hypothetical protein